MNPTWFYKYKKLALFLLLSPGRNNISIKFGQLNVTWMNYTRKKYEIKNISFNSFL